MCTYTTYFATQSFFVCCFQGNLQGMIGADFQKIKLTSPPPKKKFTWEGLLIYIYKKWKQLISTEMWKNKPFDPLPPVYVEWCILFCNCQEYIYLLITQRQIDIRWKINIYFNYIPVLLYILTIAPKLYEEMLQKHILKINHIYSITVQLEIFTPT